MTSAYQHLISKYEEALKNVKSGIARSLLFNMSFAAFWGILVLITDEIARKCCLHISIAIVVTAIWRFTYFFEERELDKELSNIVLKGVEYEKKHPQKKSYFFTKALKDFRTNSKIITRMMFLFFIMMSFKIAFFRFWMKFNYPDHLKLALLYFKPISWSYYIWFGWLIIKPFQQIKGQETLTKRQVIHK